MNHEEALVRAFIIPVRQERYLDFLKTPKKRSKLIAQLAHFKHLNPAFMVAVPGHLSNPFSLLELLVARGARKTCWVISENSELDAKEMDLGTALNQTVGYQMGNFLSCVPGRLAYFEDEDGRCILERN